MDPPHLQNSRSIGEDILYAVLPISKLLTIALVGLLLTHPKTQLIPKPTLKVLSRLVFTLFLPCFIFTQLGPTISLKNFLQWWFIPVNVVISTAVGCAIGCLVAFICRPPPEFFRFTVITTGFGNTGNIPLSVVYAVCHPTENPFGTNCSEGISYVSFSQWVSVFLVYTLVYHMMEPPLKYNEIESFSEEDEDEEGGEDEIVEIQEQEQEENLPVNVDLSTPLLVEAEWPGMEAKETEHCKTPFIARIFRSFNGVGGSSSSSRSDQMPDLESIKEEEEKVSSPKSLQCLAEPKMVRKIRTVAQHTPIHLILQPPLIATVLAIILGMIHFLLRR